MAVCFKKKNVIALTLPGEMRTAFLLSEQHALTKTNISVRGDTGVFVRENPRRFHFSVITFCASLPW